MRTYSHPVNVPGALLWHQKQQYQFQKTVEQIQGGSMPPLDVFPTFPTTIRSFFLHFSTSFFSQSLAPILGEDFEPTPIRENHHHTSNKKIPSSTTRGRKNESICVHDNKDKNGKGENLSAAAISTNVSVQSSSTCDMSNISTEKHPNCNAKQSVDSQFRRYQQKSWEDHYQALLKYQRMSGHCHVPTKYKDNLALSQWVKCQRHMYRLRKRGRTSAMTDYRIQKLEEVGFVWYSRDSHWEQRLLELRAFRDQNGHCNVPFKYPNNPSLGRWVKAQRRLYNLFRRGEPSPITQARIEALEEINFQWYGSYRK